jgi:hypothetical protein
MEELEKGAENAAMWNTRRDRVKGCVSFSVSDQEVSVVEVRL